MRKTDVVLIVTVGIGLLLYLIILNTAKVPHAPVTCPPLEVRECPIPETKEDTVKENKEDEYCPWEFIQYQVSQFEQLWVDHAEEWGQAPCKRYKLDNNAPNAVYWYQYSAQSQNTAPYAPPNSQIFSNLVYKRTCTSELVNIYIEPLVLVLRNPLFCENRSAVVDKNHMLLDWEMQRQVKDMKGKVYLFDAGASTYNQGEGGASQSWFVEKIYQRGLKIDGIWAWEYKEIKPADVFKPIPKELIPVYHWYNIPVTQESGSPSNPWEVMKQVVTEDDLVIVKLDIDTPKIEQALIQQILDTPEISKLIDVLFYEDHISTKEMRPYFGNVSETLKNSIDIFQGMRKLGIRAHPWV